MDRLNQPLWIAISVGLVALVLFVTMGAVWSKNHMPVEGKTVLVTGASEGMGRSAVRQLAAKGANVVLVSRSASKLDEAMAEAKAAARKPQTQRFHYISADVSQPDYAASLLEQVVAWNNGQVPDIVWCIAGKSTPDLWVEAPLSLTREHMDLNFWGNAEMAHAILRLWCAPDAPDASVQPDPKHLIFTSSAVALFPVIGYGTYTPAKAALRGLADTLVQELELYPQAVKVHIVYPGGISSPGFVRENVSKPEITKIIEATDPVQTPDAVAANAIAGLEKGDYAVTVGFIGSVFRWASMGGSPRHNWLVDTVMSWLVALVWIFVLPDIYGKIRTFCKERGHPNNYRKRDSSLKPH
ncbi:hypothetical protein F4808DRAFT_450853 [Astrocystis sublimbata]|nr:hypothetical protein F4808DRAFT_450853 [Astrocystis sublimbata]